MGRKKLVSDERLLEAARQVFVECGLQGSTREIARRAGVSEALLFQRYETKADLFLAAMVPPAFDLDACVPKAARGQSGERVMRDLFFGMVGYFRSASPVIIQLLANHNFEFERFALAHPDNSFVTLRWSLTGFLTEMKTAGKLGADPRAVALTLFMTSNSLAMFEMLGAHGGQFSDELIDSVITSLWEGFRPESHPKGNTPTT